MPTFISALQQVCVEGQTKRMSTMFPSSCCPIVALGGSAAARFGAILLMQFLRRRKRWVRPYRHGGKSSTGREPVLWMTLTLSMVSKLWPIPFRSKATLVPLIGP